MSQRPQAAFSGFCCLLITIMLLAKFTDKQGLLIPGVALKQEGVLKSCQDGKTESKASFLYFKLSGEE